MEMFKKLFRANFFTTGLAMFAMFFGSGNLIFPVSVGQMAGEQNGWAIFGLFITAVLLPFATLCLMLLYNGDYHRFFHRVGILPGKIIAFMTLALIGPFGVLPRCIAFSHANFSLYFPSIGLFEYSLVACIIIFALTVKKRDVVGVIGNFLTPVLLFSLLLIIVRGLMVESIPQKSAEEVSNLRMVARGIVEGYKTFDIFAALFFASAIMPAFRAVLGERMESSKKELMKLAISSSLVGIALLIGVYAGLSYVAASLQGGLVNVPADQLLAVISSMTMGQTAGLLTNVIVSLACLTTAISLALVSAEFFRKEVFYHRVSYFTCLVITLIISLLFSCLGFSGIMRLVIPALMVLCPSVIALVITNGLNYAWGFPFIKTPFYAVLLVSLIVTIAT